VQSPGCPHLLREEQVLRSLLGSSLAQTLGGACPADFCLACVGRGGVRSGLLEVRAREGLEAGG
jgi:hypothetical protein